MNMIRQLKSELEKLEILECRSLQLDMIWMWIKQNKLTIKEFKFLLEAIDRMDEPTEED